MKYVGVTGAHVELPPEFPVDMKENAGNIVHANAPMKIVKNAVSVMSKGLSHTFINEQCSHLVISFANALRLGESDDSARYEAATRFLQSIKVPVVPFGVGAQGSRYEDINLPLSDAARAYWRMLADRAPVISVRGEFTAEVLRRKFGISSNVVVTGCPSLFSTCATTYEIPFVSDKPGRPAFSGTHLFRDLERRLLGVSIISECYHIEPVSPLLYNYNLKLREGDVEWNDVPYFLKRLVMEKFLTVPQLVEHFRDRFQLFRSLDQWLEFNRSNVSFTYGTRFHVNMASLLAGVPALWVAHDTRTLELCEVFHLPHISLEQAQDLQSAAEFAQLADYSVFNRGYPELAARFVQFLEAAGLPHRIGETTDLRTNNSRPSTMGNG